VPPRDLRVPHTNDVHADFLHVIECICTVQPLREQGRVKSSQIEMNRIKSREIRRENAALARRRKILVAGKTRTTSAAAKVARGQALPITSSPHGLPSRIVPSHDQRACRLPKQPSEGIDLDQNSHRQRTGDSHWHGKTLCKHGRDGSQPQQLIRYVKITLLLCKVACPPAGETFRV
jgi:hypothetical protein